MSYLVLARKYRPRSFEEILGQSHVVGALSNALSQKRIHHAYFFTGTRGVGKTTVSRILAKSLNCTGADGLGDVTPSPCGVCPACRDIDAGRFVDYTELDAASNRGVAEVQQLLEQAVYMPVQGRFKVFMIDEVHMLSNHAFNAMLKTLEEPPSYLKFVLATTDPQKVPVTVLSRCLQFNLRPMSAFVIEQHLAQVLFKEGIRADPAALALIANAAGGSMRDALSLTDQAIAFASGDGALELAAVSSMLGSVDRFSVFEVIRCLARGDGARIVEIVNEMRFAGLSASLMLEDLALVLQKMAVFQVAPSAFDMGSEFDAEVIAELAALMPADEVQLLYSMCVHGRAELGLAPDEYVGLTMSLLRLLPFKANLDTPQKKTPLISELGAKADESSVDVVNPEIINTEIINTEIINAELINVDVGLGDFWFDLVEGLCGAGLVDGLVRELALNSQLLGIDNNDSDDGKEVWRLVTESSFLLSGDSLLLLQEVVSRKLGRAVFLSCVCGSVQDCPKKRLDGQRRLLLEQAQALISNDVYIQGIRDLYDANVLRESISPELILRAN